MTDLTFDTDAMVSFLVGLLNTPSPTGYHREAIAYTVEAFEALGIDGLTLTETPKGALLLTWPGEADDAPVALTAHIDTLGLMVKAINSDGTLTVTNLGGINWPGIDFENCTIRTHDDRRYRGTVILKNPSVHVNRKVQSTERSAESMVVRIDARTTDKEETEGLGIGVGDFVFLDPRVEVTDTGFIRSRFLDDKASVACIYGAVQALQQAGQRPAQEVSVLIANYEEVGHGGSSGLPPGLAELIAVDMAAIGEGQSSDEFSVSICVKDAGGPYHFETNNALRALCEAYDIPYKVDIYPYYASDGTAYWRAGGAARVGLVGPGVASSHGYERTHREALTHSAHLLARYMLTGGGDPAERPGR